MAKKTANESLKKPTGKKPTAMASSTTAARDAKAAAAVAAEQRATPATCNPTLSKPEIVKIQKLLKSKTAEAVNLGLSLLESLSKAEADYETVFTESLIKSILASRLPERAAAVATAVAPYGVVSELFRKLAEEKFLKRPSRLVDIYRPLARSQFVSTWGGASTDKRFIEIVQISSGSFTMGSPATEADRHGGGIKFKSGSRSRWGWGERS